MIPGVYSRKAGAGQAGTPAPLALLGLGIVETGNLAAGREPGGCLAPAHSVTEDLRAMRLGILAGMVILLPNTTLAQHEWTQWPPRPYLIRSLADGIQGILDSQDPETGRFGTEPWICSDQNVIFPLAAAWAIEDEGNPWYHNAKLLEAIGKGGEALVDAQDEAGKWTFRKKDNSTWGQIHMPWTYSRWIRAYHLAGEALPPATREKWETGLLLGFNGIRKYADGGVHNIPCHHAMALYIAGVCFENEEWKDAAKAFMAQVVAKQNPGGFWSEHFGPVVGYNKVYVEALGVYYQFSRDPVALDALSRSANFHASVLWPDGSSVSAIDERQIYHARRDIGNVGFAWTPEGRGFLLEQVAAYADEGALLDADYAAAMLLYGGEGEGQPPAAAGDRGRVTLGDDDALIERRKPWQWCFSAYACEPIQNRWIQDRHNLVDVFHDELGLVIGGGNTKLQPYWSTFTVGDPSLLRHEPGDESPNFIPEIDLHWTPDEADIDLEGEAPRLTLKYGDTDCWVSAQARDDGGLALTYGAPLDRGVEAHVPLFRRAVKVKTASGDRHWLGEEELLLGQQQMGDHVAFGGLRVTLPAGASLRWPAQQHNPYKKDGSSSLGAAKLVLVLPFENGITEHTLVLSRELSESFEGLTFEARDLPFRSDTGTRTKRLDVFGSQFLGSEKPGDSIAFTLPAIEAGRYELVAEFVLADTYGIVRVLLDGEPIGEPFDGYCPGVDDEGERVSFGEVELTGGEHEVIVEIVGQNEQSKGHFISVKRWLLRPVEG